MESSSDVVDSPTRLVISPTGELTGATRHYEKQWGQLGGLFRDAEAYAAVLAERGAESLSYYVNEQKYQDGPGALIVGTSTLLPAAVGDEFTMTRGHLHAIPDRAELYYCLSGHGIMLLDTIDGQSIAVELRPGEAVNVPGHWVHRSVNVGTEPFVTMFCYNADAGQDYELIADAGGMRTLIVRDGDGWAQIPNPDHTGYQAASA